MAEFNCVGCSDVRSKPLNAFKRVKGLRPDAATAYSAARLRLSKFARTSPSPSQLPRVTPQDGRNAATGLVHQLDRIAGIVPLSGDGPTLNLTLLNAGTCSNIIPDEAEAQFSLRIRKPEQRDEILAKLNAAMEPTLDTRVSVMADPGYPPLIETPAVDALTDRAAKIYGELGKPLGRGGNGGASESAVVQSVGTPALDGLGLVGRDFHTDHEWIDLNSLEPRLYLITRLIMDTGAKPPAKLHQ